jgi:hypothetical protein
MTTFKESCLVSSRKFTYYRLHEDEPTSPTIATGDEFHDFSNREAQINDCDNIDSGRTLIARTTLIQRSFIPGSRITKHKYCQICSSMKFTEQNFLSSILSQTLRSTLRIPNPNSKILSISIHQVGKKRISRPKCSNKALLF